MTNGDLIKIGRLAVADNTARAARNKAQSALKKWRKEFQLATYEPYVTGSAEPEDEAEHEALMGAKLAATAEYYRARSATRRAIAKAA